jgi:Heterokaryon incompatibility protein (HET)
MSVNPIESGSLKCEYNQEYLYEHLRSEHHIRLLRVGEVVPSVEPSPRQLPPFEIVQADMRDLPKYQAVSYVWGDPQRNQRINILPDHFYPITDSMAIALRQLLYHCDTGHLWIDQICIAQEDIGERNHQVSIMGSIYRNAEEVLICVGDSIRDLEEVGHEINSGIEVSLDWLEPFRWLIGRPWFERVWYVNHNEIAKNDTKLTRIGLCKRPPSLRKPSSWLAHARSRFRQ